MTASAMQNRAGLKQLIAAVEALPAPSPVAGRILDLAIREDVALDALAECLETDPSLSVTLLKLANRASHGPTGGGEVRSVRQATMLLGLDTVRTAALCVAVRDGLFSRPMQADGPVRHVWEHSLACACAAGLLAEAVRPPLAGAAFAAGLLHDCGKLAMLSALPGACDALLDQGLFGAELAQAEQQTFGVDHCLAGKWLLEHWRLPQIFVDAAWLHHQPPALFDALLDKGDPLPLVALADHLAREAMGGPVPDPTDPARQRLLAACGLAGEKTPTAVKAALGERFARKAALFNLNEDPAAFYFSALQRANAALGRTALDLRRLSATAAAQAARLAGVAEAGARLENALDPLEVLVRLGAGLAGAFACPEGLVCLRQDPSSPRQAVFWDASGPGAPKTLPEEAASLAAALRPPYPALLAGASVRLGAALAADGACLHLQDGFTVATAALDGGGHLELLLRPEPSPRREQAPSWSGREGLAGSDNAAFRHLALLGAGAVRRLALIEESRAKAENLAQAMRSMQALSAKLLQTERLAAVGQLAAGAAHEINNPLAIISARAQLLEMKEADPVKKRGFRQMVEQIERISAILSNLMDFARPAPLRVESVSLAAVLTRVLDLVRGGLARQNIAAVLDVAPDMPLVQADSRQLEQVFLNLVINAEHAMEASGGSLTVTARYDPASDQVEVDIADTGVGISSENLDKIFDPFFTTKAEGKGTGLGLSTSYAVVAKHQGDISVESAPGKGARVRVRLPRDAARPLTPQEPAPARPPREDAILVVDDEQHIRDILRESLEAAGFAVALAADGDQALDMLAARRFRLVILDIRMPRRDGLAFLREASPSLAGAPVMVLTGLAGEDEIRQAMDLGAACCLRKPFQIDALTAEVKRLLTAQRP